jgi:hypothetical protein
VQGCRQTIFQEGGVQTPNISGGWVTECISGNFFAGMSLFLNTFIGKNLKKEQLNSLENETKYIKY